LSITEAFDRLQVHVTSVTHAATVTLNERLFAMPGYAAAQDLAMRWASASTPWH
jgi:hypothetical protein